MTGRTHLAHGIHDWIRVGNMPPAADQYLDELSYYTDVLYMKTTIQTVCVVSDIWGIAWTHNMVFYTGLLHRLVVVVTTMQKWFRMDK